MLHGNVFVLLALAAVSAFFTTVAGASAGFDSPPPSIYEMEKMFIMTGWGWDPNQMSTTPQPEVLAAPAPPILAYSSSLDYGGQPANYDSARISSLKDFPVDRRQGAPAPLQPTGASGAHGDNGAPAAAQP